MAKSQLKEILETIGIIQLILSALFIASSGYAQTSETCSPEGVQLQILGSGGPFGDDGRASSAYLLWIDGKSRIMVDAGGGSFLRFHEAGANLADIQLLGISHFHPDHSAELPALLWPRSGMLRVAGPAGDAGWPSLDDYLDGMFGSAGFVSQLGRQFEFEAITLSVNGSVTEVLNQDQIRMSSIGVPHGNVPTLAFRIDTESGSVAFSSDQNGSDPDFIDFVRGVDVLVVHFAADEVSNGNVPANLHAKPSVWGEIASNAEVGRLVLSHRTANQKFEENLQALATTYSGPLTFAEDLMCLGLD